MSHRYNNLCNLQWHAKFATTMKLQPVIGLSQDEKRYGLRGYSDLQQMVDFKKLFY